MKLTIVPVIAMTHFVREFELQCFWDEVYSDWTECCNAGTLREESNDRGGEHVCCLELLLGFDMLFAKIRDRLSFC